MSTWDVDSPEAQPIVAHWLTVRPGDDESMCLQPSADNGKGSWSCTRIAGHDTGPHISYDWDAPRVMAVWPTTDQNWQVRVTVPASLSDELRTALGQAIADAVHTWEPADRDGWDPIIEAGPA